jgi:hypothetical protein
MDPGSVAEEVRAYFSWSEGLRRSLKPQQLLVSQHYRSQYLSAYSRYSLLKGEVHGAPSICIADISVEQPGRGLFTALCDLFEATDCPAHAHALFVENVANPRFMGWLTRRGFSMSPHSHPQAPSFYLVRPPGMARV